jgi:ABC-type Fe3+/spermidine/putrescine transport system ATPase subunit
MQMIELKNLTKAFDERTLFNGLNLRCEKGEIVSILGPSGCGKSTLLRICCGLIEADAGERWTDDGIIENGVISPTIAMLFQQPVLFPHLNVGRNIALGGGNEISKNELSKQVTAVLNFVDMPGTEGKNITTLSGGEGQRVAFARALLQSPNVMLLDEPFASLGLEQRHRLAKDTRKRLKSRSITTIHVTHDEEEAVIMADRVISWKELLSSSQTIPTPMKEDEQAVDSEE